MPGRKTNPTPSGDVLHGTLYIVATPIGNLEDITQRAIRILSEVHWIACEDTRRTSTLLHHHGISTRLISYHEHNERERAAELVAALERGESGALVSDAGTPLVSDPGFRLVSAAIERGIRVVPLPGASAVLAALAGSGLPCDEYLFAGFLPARRSERRRALERLRAEPRTLVVFEAPHRLAASLADAAEILGTRRASIGRELTKVYEEFRRGTLAELAKQFSGGPVRGEITIVVGPPAKHAAGTHHEALSAEQTVSLGDRVAELMRAENLPRNAALKRAARERGLTRREAYRRLLLEA